MRNIKKANAAPASLTSFCQKHPTKWEEIHNPENKSVYRDCLETCIADQGNLCGYTEIFLKEETRHIDHYIKRNIDNRLTFSWDNMIAAVKDSRFGADYKDDKVTSKDYDRQTRRYVNILNLITDEIKERFIYCSDGTMEPADKNDFHASNTIEVFNLNHASLKSQRSNFMQSVRHLLNGGVPKDMIKTLLKPSGFLSVLEYELSKEP